MLEGLGWDILIGVIVSVGLGAAAAITLAAAYGIGGCACHCCRICFHHCKGRLRRSTDPQAALRESLDAQRGVFTQK